MAAVIAATHHEWWNGTGYPSGLAGERIPIVGRVVAVADVFDALTHARPYKPAWPARQAIARIERGAGSQFDPRVVAAFLAVHAQGVDSQDGARNGGPPEPAGQPAPPAEPAPAAQPLNEWNSPSALGSVGVNGVNA